MIDGLRLTMTGEEIRKILNDRIDHHTRRAEQWRQDEKRPHEERSEMAQWQPDGVCFREADAADWRAQRLAFIREHIDPSEVYRLGTDDPGLADLLPPQPLSVEMAAE